MARSRNFLISWTTSFLEHVSHVLDSGQPEGIDVRILDHFIAKGEQPKVYLLSFNYNTHRLLQVLKKELFRDFVSRLPVEEQRLIFFLHVLRMRPRHVAALHGFSPANITAFKKKLKARFEYFFIVENFDWTRLQVDPQVRECAFFLLHRPIWAETSRTFKREVVEAAVEALSYHPVVQVSDVASQVLRRFLRKQDLSDFVFYERKEVEEKWHRFQTSEIVKG